MIVHRERVRRGGEGCVILGLLKSFCEQTLNRMVGSAVEDVRRQRFRQSTAKESAE